MTARVAEIEEWHLQTPGTRASLADFTCTEGDEINPTVVVEDSDLNLYCLDDVGRRAIFVKLPPGFNLTSVPFCSLPVSRVEKALSAFKQDAQAGTPLAREDPKRGNRLKLADQQINDIHDVLRRHLVVNTPDFALPGTLEL